MYTGSKFWELPFARCGRYSCARLWPVRHIARWLSNPNLAAVSCSWSLTQLLFVGVACLWLAVWLAWTLFRLDSPPNSQAWFRRSFWAAFGRVDSRIGYFSQSSKVSKVLRAFRWGAWYFRESADAVYHAARQCRERVLPLKNWSSASIVQTQLKRSFLPSLSRRWTKTDVWRTKARRIPRWGSKPSQLAPCIGRCRSGTTIGWSAFKSLCSNRPWGTWLRRGFGTPRNIKSSQHIFVSCRLVWLVGRRAPTWSARWLPAPVASSCAALGRSRTRRSPICPIRFDLRYLLSALCLSPRRFEEDLSTSLWSQLSIV